MAICLWCVVTAIVFHATVFGQSEYDGSQGGQSESIQSAPQLSATPVSVGLPMYSSVSRGELIGHPKVVLGAPMNEVLSGTSAEWFAGQRPSADMSLMDPYLNDESLPAPREALTNPPPNDFPSPNAFLPSRSLLATPIFEGVLSSTSNSPVRRRRNACGQGGLGADRLAFSLFDIDPAQPFNNFRIRTGLGYGFQLPDRSEYRWAKTRTGAGPPSGESTLNYQEARMRMELGSKKFSTAFEIPILAVDPQVNRNHAGLGDLQLVLKTVLLDGKDWMLTQYFGTRFPTGSAGAGLGSGHVSLEPGLLFRNRMREQTWMHGELKFWFPLGADPSHGGQVLKFATGFNTVWSETDTSAWLPSLEFSTFSFLNGMATDATGALRAIDGDGMLYVTPGLRYAVDRKGDMGLFEVGTAVSLATTRERMTDSTWLFDMRWSW